MAHSANITSTTGFTNGYSGRSNATAVVAMDDGGLFGCLPGEDKPYMPCGGRKVIADLYSQGLFTFKSYSFGPDCSIKKGRKL